VWGQQLGHPLDEDPTLTGVGVTSLSGFQFEIKVVVRLPTTT
jgi:hypothetical protein